MGLTVDPHRVADTETLEKILSVPTIASAHKKENRLGQLSQAFVHAAPFAMLATSGPGRLDTAPRSGPAGFIKVEDESTLLIPDRHGESRATLYNVISDPRIALLFLIPGRGETLKVTGRATITTDPALLNRFFSSEKAPRCLIKVHVETVTLLCTGVLDTQRLAPGQLPDLADVPTLQTFLSQFSAQDTDPPGFGEKRPNRVRITLY